MLNVKYDDVSGEYMWQAVDDEAAVMAPSMSDLSFGVSEDGAIVSLTVADVLYFYVWDEETGNYALKTVSEVLPDTASASSAIKWCAITPDKKYIVLVNGSRRIEYHALDSSGAYVLTDDVAIPFQASGSCKGGLSDDGTYFCFKNSNNNNDTILIRFYWEDGQYQGCYSNTSFDNEIHESSSFNSYTLPTDSYFRLTAWKQKAAQSCFFN